MTDEQFKAEEEFCNATQKLPLGWFYLLGDIVPLKGVKIIRKRIEPGRFGPVLYSVQVVYSDEAVYGDEVVRQIDRLQFDEAVSVRGATTRSFSYATERMRRAELDAKPKEKV